MRFRPLALLGASALLVGVATFIGTDAAGADTLPPACGTPRISGTQATVVCAYTGAAQSFTYPAGVTSATFQAAGSAGVGAGGYGGEASGTLTEPEGTQLIVQVGGPGTAATPQTGGTGGYGGGGGSAPSTTPGGGGGGGTFVQTTGFVDLLVGGGGGGGGGGGAGCSGGRGGGSAIGGPTACLHSYGAAASTNAPSAGIAAGDAGGPGDGGGGGGYVGGAAATDGSGGGDGGQGYMASAVQNPIYISGTNDKNGVVYITYTVPKTTPTITFTTPAAGATGIIGQSVMPVTTVSDGETPTYSSSGACSGTTTVTFTAAGTCTIQASTAGNSTANPATATTTISVGQAGTTTSVSSVPAGSSTYGTAVTFTATVAVAAPGTGTPAGNVVFYDGNVTPTNQVASVPLAVTGGQDQASYTTPSTFPAGGHTITASYTGSPSYTGSNNSETFTVGKGTPGITWTPSTTTITYGAKLTSGILDATANPSAGTFAYTVTPTAGGPAQTVDTTTAPLAAGTYNLTATFTPTDTADYSTAAVTLPFSVNKAGQTVTFANGIPASAVFGQTVPVSATASTGETVSYSASGACTYANGSVTITAVGTCTVTASAPGDANTGPGSAQIAIAANPAATSTTLTDDSSGQTVYGSPVTFTATVAPTAPGAGTPSGTVDFHDGSVDLGPVGLQTASSGARVATLTLSTLAGGTHNITATYSGDPDFTTSTAAADNYTVLAADPGLTPGGAEEITYGSSLAGVLGSSVSTGAAAHGSLSYSTVIAGTPTPLTGATVLHAGTYTVTVTYTPADGDYTTASATFGLTVDKANQTIDGLTPPDPGVVGQATTLAATADPVGSAPASGESVSYTASGACSVAGTTLTYTSPGTCTLTASVPGGSDYNTASGTVTPTVQQATTTTLVGDSLGGNPMAYGQSVSFTASVAPVSPGAGVPTGTVDFSVNGGPAIPETLAGGQATFTTTSLQGGQDTITATYTGDTNFAGSTTTSGDTVTVVPAPTTTTVTATPTAGSTYGQAVTFTATVARVSAGPGSATGTVVFHIGGKKYPEPLAVDLPSGNDEATVTISNLPAGPASVGAVYGGDPDFGASDTGNPSSYPVAQAAQTIQGLAPPATAVVGQTYPLAATVSSMYLSSGETVTYSATGTCSITGSTLTFTAVGSCTVTANAAGDTNYLPASTQATTTVGQSSTATILTLTPTGPTTYGNPVTFTAVVTPVAPGGGTPGGTVNFYDGSIANPIGTAQPLVFDQPSGNDEASVTTSALTAGPHTIIAIYHGAPGYTGSENSASLTVNKATPTVTWPTPAPVTYGTALGSILDATATPTGGTFAYTATDGSGTTSPVSATTVLPAGAYSLAVTYTPTAGDAANYTTATAGVQLTVNKAGTTTAVTATPSPATYGQTVTFTATVTGATTANTPTGTVQFHIGSAPKVPEPLVNGVATYTTTAPLGAGPYTVGAVYGGDGNFIGSDDTTALTVNQAGQTIDGFAPPATAVVGQTYTPSATADPSGDPVTFGVTGSCSIAGGVVTFTATGSCTVTASTAGDANYLPATVTGPATTISRAATSTTVTQTPANPAYGDSVTVTATVAPVSPGAGTPSGQVTFYDGPAGSGTNLGMATLAGGTNGDRAGLVGVHLQGGAHTITAVYGGDGNFVGSSGTDTLTVARTADTVTGLNPPATAVVGQTFTPAASAASGDPVTFSVSGTCAISSGLVTFTAAGSCTVTASTAGDANYLPASEVGPATLISKAVTTTTVSSSPASSGAFGAPVTFTATESPTTPGAASPTGTVTFYDGTVAAANQIGSGTLASATVSVTTSKLAAGPHTVIAVYGGDPGYTGSQGSESFTVNAAAPLCSQRLPSGTVVGMAGIPDGNGYWIANSSGLVSACGEAPILGQLTSAPTASIVGIAATPDGGGYWLVGSDGNVYPFGDAHNYGSMLGVHLTKPVVGMAADPATGGYWLVASDGGVFAFNAPFKGSAGNINLAKPVVGMAGTADGYDLVASDGGVFTYGLAFYGSAGNIKLNKPVVGMTIDPNTGGYWLVASDGGIFTYGPAPFYGSAGNINLAKPVVGMSVYANGAGYRMVASDGGIFSYSAPFEGSAA